MNKIILDLCGGTGAWSRPYREAGYDVRVITVPEHDVRTYEPPENVYGILAAPPCTMFSIARQHTAKIPRNFQEGLDIVDACMKIIWKCRIQNKLSFWAMENPRGYLRQFIGKPVLTFNPSDYGDPYTKATDIWGYFNEPTKKSVKPTIGRDYALSLEIPKGHRPPDMTPQKIRRSITPRGFAQAFFKANL